jgi:gamma-glutamyltranspeptidase/glutathione hydrolase
MGFAMAATHPFAGNLGGGGFMLIRFADGRSTFIDFRERAPEKASRNMYLDAKGELTKDSIEGWRSSGSPRHGPRLRDGGEQVRQTHVGTEHGAGDRAGQRLPALVRALGVAPQLARSREGSGIEAHLPEERRVLRDGRDAGAAGAGADARAHFEERPDEFYEGETAKRFADEMAKHGGLISLADLKSYKAIERTPLTGKYKNYTIITSPPSSSGGIALLEMLGILEGTGYDKAGAGSAAAIHYEAEAMRLAYADRNEYVGDPAFVKVPIAGLLDPAYLAKLRASIDPERATPSDRVKPGKPVGSESMETTHYSVVDSEGNAVAVTYTLNGGFGNGITVPGLGFLLNNEMDDFSAKPGTANMFGLVQGENNAIAPGKRPLSSMTPTIVLKDGKLFMTAGAPGGSRISTACCR